MNYHYTECGLDNVYLTNGFEVTRTEDGDEEVFIHDIHGLHRAIGLCLVTKPSRLEGNEIRFIRHTLDVSQTSFARLMGVTYQSVLNWEKGKVDLPKTADHLMKALFFSYLNRDGSRVVYDKINEIADLDADEAESAERIVFEERASVWRMAA